MPTAVFAGASGARPRASSSAALPTAFPVDATGAGTQIVSFGQAFKQGALPSGQVLTASYSGGSLSVQTDVLTTFGDGSARYGIVTLQAPSGSNTISLSKTASGSTTPPTFPGGHTATLIIEGTSYDLLSGGSLVRNRCSGNLMKSQRRKISVTGKSYLYILATSEIRSDGSLVVDAQIRCDIGQDASATGYTLSSMSIVLNGVTKASWTSLAVPLYSGFGRQMRWCVNTSGTTLAEPLPWQDSLYFAECGVIPFFDWAVTPDSSLNTGYASMLGSADWNDPTKSRGLAYDMTGTGDRDELGPVNQPASVWFLTGNVNARNVMIGWAEIGAECPWHFQKSGAYLNPFDTDWGGNAVDWGFSPMVMGSGGPSSPWTIEPAHQANVYAHAYLVTGREHFLDGIKAAAAYSLFKSWTGYRGSTVNITTGSGLLPRSIQERSVAWSLRSLRFAALYSEGSERTIWSDVLTGCSNALNGIKTALTTEFGATVSGFFKADTDTGTRWSTLFSEGYFQHSLCDLLADGRSDFDTFASWHADWAAAHFLQSGTFNPKWGFALDYTWGADAGGGTYTPCTTWAQVETQMGLYYPGGADAHLDWISGKTGDGSPAAGRWVINGMARLLRAYPSKTALASAWTVMLGIADSDAGWQGAWNTKAKYQEKPKFSIVPPGFTRS